MSFCGHARKNIKWKESEIALDCLGYALSEVIDVVAVKTSHRDTAIRGHVDVCFLSEGLGLRLSKAGEAACPCQPLLSILGEISEQT
jgi:hypothetical protein